MLPKLVWYSGVAAVAAGATMFAIASVTPETRSTHNPYTLTVSKNASNHFVILDKPPGTPPLFELDYYGAISFTVRNSTLGPINLMMHQFRKGPGGRCPIEFIMNGNTTQCVGRANIREGGAPEVIFGIRGDANPNKTERYKFDITVNGQNVDPEIEIERDPGGRNLLKYWIWLLFGGGLSLLLGRWLGARS